MSYRSKNVWRLRIYAVDYSVHIMDYVVYTMDYMVYKVLISLCHEIMVYVVDCNFIK